jgi:hypothetical protein
MFYKVKTNIAEIYDQHGEFILPAKRKYKQAEMSIYSKDKSQVLTKAGRNLGAHGYSHNGMEIIK